MVFQMIFASITAVIIYHLVIEPKRCNTTSATLLGFGLILPFWIWICPFRIAQSFQIHHLLMKFCVGSITPTLCIFRTMEAIYGFTPPYATSSLKDFVVYFASVMLFTRRKVDDKDKDSSSTLVKCSLGQVFNHFINFMLYLCLLGTVKSILIRYPNLIVFGEYSGNTNKTEVDQWYTSFERFGTWELYANNLLIAIMFQLYLTTYCEGLILFWMVLSGYQVDEVMANPLATSQSPSEFWGRKWNLIIHNVLKGGIYKPIRKFTNSAMLAMIGVFLASGLFHEWQVWFIMTPASKHITADEPATANSESYFQPRYYGGMMIFMIWQSLIIGIEMMIGNTRFIKSLTQRMPRPLKTCLVIMLGLPVAHFFGEPYVRSTFFEQGSIGLPMIKHLN